MSEVRGRRSERQRARGRESRRERSEVSLLAQVRKTQAEGRKSGIRRQKLESSVSRVLGNSLLHRLSYR